MLKRNKSWVKTSWLSHECWTVIANLRRQGQQKPKVGLSDCHLAVLFWFIPTILPHYLGKTLCLVSVADFPPLLTEEIPVISGRCCYKSLMQDGAYWSWHSLNFLNLILSRWCMNSDFHSVESPLFSLEKQELRIEKKQLPLCTTDFLVWKGMGRYSMAWEIFT